VIYTNPKAADVALHADPSLIPAETSWMHLPMKPNYSSTAYQETSPAYVNNQAISMDQHLFI